MPQRLLAVLFIAVFLGGCATSGQDKTMVSQLQTRVGQLEQQLEVKDNEIKNLEEEIKTLSYDVERTQTRSGSSDSYGARDYSQKISFDAQTPGKIDAEIIRVAVQPQKIQLALKNAGYYNGTIDGKVGAMTKQAISLFQKDHGLNSDGVVGRRTWTELEKYLK